MRRFYLLTRIALLMFGFFFMVSCSKDKDDPVDPNITITGSAELTLSDAASTQSVPFTSTVDWTASVAGSPAWLTVTPPSGTAGSGSLSLTVAKNETYDDRSATITISGPGATSKTVTVTQKKLDALILSKTTQELPAEGGTVEVELKTNLQYDVTIRTADQSWISRSDSRALTTYNLKFAVAANTTTEAREGQIIVKDKNSTLYETITIKQAAAKPEDYYDYSLAFVHPDFVTEPGVSLTSLMVYDDMVISNYGDLSAPDDYVYTFINSLTDGDLLVFGNAGEVMICEYDPETGERSSNVTCLVPVGDTEIEIRELYYHWATNTYAVLSTQTVAVSADNSRSVTRAGEPVDLRMMVHEQLVRPILKALNDLTIPLANHWAVMMKDALTRLGQNPDAADFLSKSDDMGSDAVVEAMLDYLDNRFAFFKYRDNPAMINNIVALHKVRPEMLMKAWKSEAEIPDAFALILALVKGTQFNYIPEETPEPVSVTITVSNVQTTSANISGMIRNASGLVKDRGVYVSEGSNPASSGNKTSFETGDGSSSIGGTISGLKPGTDYYACTYVTIGNKTVYSDPVKFTTLSAKFTIDPPSATFSASGGNATFDVQAPDPWKVSSKPTWATVSISENKLTVTVQANTTGQILTGEIKLTAEPALSEAYNASISLTVQGEVAEGFFGGTAFNKTSWSLIEKLTYVVKDLHRAFDMEKKFYTYWDEFSYEEDPYPYLASFDGDRMYMEMEGEGEVAYIVNGELYVYERGKLVPVDEDVPTYVQLIDNNSFKMSSKGRMTDEDWIYDAEYSEVFTISGGRMTTVRKEDDHYWYTGELGDLIGYLDRHFIGTGGSSGTPVTFTMPDSRAVRSASENGGVWKRFIREMIVKQ